VKELKEAEQRWQAEARGRSLQVMKGLERVGQ
jgi:hypothetical protein